ncbi:proline dehydrogenase family protein [Candidatus Sulfidibacterium hydrothermale]|uniref:proline dehydrogenase family protein n=1 Tax=Candidatus Sulfidibacterium hydrothermale TaxID=2875962 RepID=UPI001F0AEF54|nr:proline dehydrogenase family protein [Candidatus Sulfidibacterium hydrothermale]UBM62740.1 proline dehydrogenase family protein [Candidatus Sulfidibacterium hydrothermale]
MMWFNKMIASILPHMPKRLVWIFSKRYIAGQTIDDAVRVSKQLNAEGYMVTIDLLGEFITELHEAEKNRDQYLNIIDTIQKNQIDGNYSLKPSMFGLLLDEEACYRNIREIVAKAVSYNNFVRIDMEDSSCVDREIKLFRRLKEEFPKNVGLVLQAYMRRTLDDLKNLSELNSKDNPLNFRLCKGIYVEPEEIAYKDYDEINRHYLEDLEFILKNGMYPGIATHDIPLIEGAYRLLEKYKVPKDRYEFQMLYGVTPGLRKSIIEKGHRLRVYVPFGEDWFPYSTRRLKENPKVASDIMKALFIRG